MARMYARRRGRSGSSKPLHPQSGWVGYSKNEVEKIVGGLANDGMTGSVIGLVLRDRYGIPAVKMVTKKKMLDLLPEQEFPEDLQAILTRMDRLIAHFKRNKRDVQCKRRIELVDAKIRRLVGYYRGKDRLPVKWAYKREKV